MAFAEFAPDQTDGAINDDVRQLGKKVRNTLQGMQAGQILNQESEELRMVHLAQDIHFYFRVIMGFSQSAIQLLPIGVKVCGSLEQALIQQFVE